MDEHTNERIDSLIEQYLSDRIDRASLAELSRRAAQSDDTRRYVRDRLEVWFSAGMEGEAKGIDMDEKFKSLTRRMAADTRETQSSGTRRRTMMGIAAAVAAVLVVALPWMAFRYGVRTVKQNLGVIAMETPPGSQTKLTLPDGTTVWLNADSKIAYSQSFGIDNRDVSLTGEACFDVTHNERLPFQINAKELDLKVLGTKFTYTDYPDEKTIKVDLMDGKVFLKNNADGSGMTLKPNERMVYDKTSHRMWRRPLDTSMSASWTTGRLFFDEQPLAEIASTLSRAYNVKVRVADRLKGAAFYGSFDINNTSVEDVLRMIAATHKARYKYENGAYTLY